MNKNRVSEQGVSEFDLQAIVDGELDMDKQSILMTKIKKCPALLSRLEELFYQKILLKSWWRSLPVD